MKSGIFAHLAFIAWFLFDEVLRFMSYSTRCESRMAEKMPGNHCMDKPPWKWISANRFYKVAFGHAHHISY
jgi:hypothetical protein